MTAIERGTWQRRAGQRGTSSAVAAVLVVLVVFWSAAGASAAAKVAFTISDSRISQPSGLATDTGSQLYWAADSSAGSGVAYGLTKKGHVRGSLRFRAQPRDVEAVAWSRNRLYVADIGDKDGSRPFVTVYYFDNPSADNRQHIYNAYDFTYPDGKHDAASLLVDAAGRIFLVTRGPRPGIYAAPVKPSRQRVNTLSRVADAPVSVSDGAFLPQDGRVALRTEGAVEILDGKTFAQLSRVVVPGQPRGESLTVSLDGASLLVGSSGAQASVVAVDVPKAAGAGASPSTAPSGSPDTSAADPSADDNAAPAQSKTGTLLALGLAAFVALVAGLVVAAVRTPKPASSVEGAAEQPGSDSGRQKLADNPVDAPAQGDDVVGLDAGKHPDP